MKRVCFGKLQTSLCITFYIEVHPPGSNHPQNVKRGDVGLYVKDSLSSTNRSDLATLPECAVCEIQLNRKRYSLSLSIEVQVRTSVISIISQLTLSYCYLKCRLKILFA